MLPITVIFASLSLIAFAVYAVIVSFNEEFPKNGFHLADRIFMGIGFGIMLAVCIVAIFLSAHELNNRRK